MKKFCVTDVTPDSNRFMQGKVLNFLSRLSKKWPIAYMILERFLNENKSWLDPYYSSSSGGSQLQGRPKRTLKTHLSKTKSLVRLRNAN